MQLGIIKRYKSWLTSAAITLVIALWLFSGQFGEQQNPVVDTNQSSQQSTSQPQQLAGVRVRQQAAELVTRTITVNGRTAPARVVELNAETDGRVESVGVERGERLNKGDIIVELDERDRKARL
ncbi:MAG: multidrug efflux system membrane fusion protein, partial [Woeseiaceae bacterium]